MGCRDKLWVCHRQRLPMFSLVQVVFLFCLFPGPIFGVVEVSPAEPPFSWRAGFQFAPPNAAFFEGEVRFSWASSSAAVELWSIPFASWGGAASVLTPIDDNLSVGMALSAVGRVGRSVRFGMADCRVGAFEVEVPAVQHPAMPLRTVWRLKRPVEFGRRAFGAAFVRWSPGRPPRVYLTAQRDGWRFCVGSAGVFVAREVILFRSTKVQWRFGLMRASIPWCGATIGRVEPWRPAGFSASSLWDLSP